ncbi:hypothetical protein SCLCIDRAFT_1223613 [Scleroderma citrinum Foug A]|uniref:Uncharacterized protein n=1 Tax=Scleroderma citrinum Foug A TaxID=1036808 RepID=A0A0C3D939_9AGAM|nr:hypothetical protein SCLCIDRAFT_1223613 [Scleroderma citrinum Foug A]
MWVGEYTDPTRYNNNIWHGRSIHTKTENVERQVNWTHSREGERTTRKVGSVR